MLVTGVSSSASLLSSVMTSQPQNSATQASGGFVFDQSQGQMTLSGEQELTAVDFYTGIPQSIMSGLADYMKSTGQGGSVSSLITLLPQATADALKSSDWLQEMASYGSSLGLSGASYVSGTDAFSQDLNAIGVNMQAEGTSVANYLETLGYSHQQATEDGSMLAYKFTVDSLRTLAGDIGFATGGTTQFEIASSVTGVETTDAGKEAFALSTDEAWQGGVGIKDNVSLSALVVNGTSAVAAAAVIAYGPSVPPESTAAVSVDAGAASAALAGIEGYQTSFSITEVNRTETQATALQMILQHASSGGNSTTSASAAWASVDIWQQTIEMGSGGNSHWSVTAKEGSQLAQIQTDSAWMSSARETEELVQMTAGSVNVRA